LYCRYFAKVCFLLLYIYNYFTVFGQVFLVDSPIIPGDKILINGVDSVGSYAYKDTTVFTETADTIVIPTNQKWEITGITAYGELSHDNNNNVVIEPLFFSVRVFTNVNSKPGALVVNNTYPYLSAWDGDLLLTNISISLKPSWTPLNQSPGNIFFIYF
jgi:hypothetical protein